MATEQPFVNCHTVKRQMENATCTANMVILIAILTVSECIYIHLMNCHYVSAQQALSLVGAELIILEVNAIS